MEKKEAGAEKKKKKVPGWSTEMLEDVPNRRDFVDV